MARSDVWLTIRKVARPGTGETAWDKSETQRCDACGAEGQFMVNRDGNGSVICGACDYETRVNGIDVVGIRDRFGPVLS